jgi:hypothetical protein
VLAAGASADSILLASSFLDPTDPTPRAPGAATVPFSRSALPVLSDPQGAAAVAETPPRMCERIETRSRKEPGRLPGCGTMTNLRDARALSARQRLRELERRSAELLRQRVAQSTRRAPTLTLFVSRKDPAWYGAN